jgi:hypothetical protein
MMTFGQAIEAMRAGKKVSRTGWNGKGMWNAIENPNLDSTMTEPFVYMRTAQGGLIPWLASQADILACDFEIVT